LIIFNRVPIIGFDFYINSKREIFFEDNLNEPPTIEYWLNTHMEKDSLGQRRLNLFIGTGFDSTIFTLNKKYYPILQKNQVYIRQALTPDAIRYYNAAIDSGLPAVILIKNE
jgi:hypothetical protein